MVQFVKGKPGYYYKVFNNGKKVRISKDDFMKSTYKSTAGYDQTPCHIRCNKNKKDLKPRLECIRECFDKRRDTSLNSDIVLPPPTNNFTPAIYHM